ncbi:MAG: hypothetical protein AB7G08_31880 [Hyphomicrobiaceae bacterium]
MSTHVRPHHAHLSASFSAHAPLESDAPPEAEAVIVIGTKTVGEALAIALFAAALARFVQHRGDVGRDIMVIVI